MCNHSREGLGPSVPAGGCAWKKGDQIKGRKKRETFKRKKGPGERTRGGQERKASHVPAHTQDTEMSWPGTPS